MVKQIIWSPLAKEALKNLMLSTLEKHPNKQYGKMMYSLFQHALYRASQNPFNGQATEMKNIRFITPHPDYSLFYRHNLQKIEVLVLWDNHYKQEKLETVKQEQP